MMPRLEYKEIKEMMMIKAKRAPVLDSLCIKLGPQCPVNVDVGKWVAKAVDRFVRKLKFKLLWSADLISLPKSLYTCKMLIFLLLPRLPSLKKLNLINVVYTDDASLIRVKRERNENIKYFYVIVPSLRDLWCHDYNRKYVGNPLPRSLSSVLFLEFFLADEMEAFSLYLSLLLVRYSTINFSRLTELVICPDKSDWLEPLLLLLGNSPKLKKLLVDYVGTNRNPRGSPTCMERTEFSSWLLVLSLSGRNMEEEQKRKNSLRATISLRSAFNLEEKQKVMEELESIPRVSKSSQLLLK
ncbi:hypothetical protein ARALYDRAFT_494496 [Arabidopsis lyrata subsp. lyrata]|uniref:FBD domain-containing protein n=1 Tax=Arabidopsis lyrata subsp. lyrata TaxID=81972 RepID=D7MLG2_ARALL|nr:hypothetical protein ARALYDRAFT_494496 [Arabidopsis lyrata subsp. lyrata]